MEKSELFKILDSIFSSEFFKKKGNSWSAENEKLRKLIQLQRSSFGNYYYLNFGIIFKGLDYSDVTTHIYRRLGSLDVIERQEINALLDLDSIIPNNQREDRLQFYIEKEILKYFEDLNNENDVAKTLGTVVPLSTIPFAVKEYLKIK